MVDAWHRPGCDFGQGCSCFFGEVRRQPIPAAEPVNLDPTPTPISVAIVPEARPDPEDARVDRLLGEVFALLKERKALYEVADMRATRGRELLEEARTAKRLGRALLEAFDRWDELAGHHGYTVEEVREAHGAFKAARAAFQEWAAKTL